jgi:hypothetical protein
MQTFSSEQLDAVFLWEGNTIVRDLLWPEFEAILDGFIPVNEYAGRLAKAVFVRVDCHLHITAAVFFVLEVDADGMVSRRWNVPLFRLVEQAATGPDLGAGPIRLACFSQCAIEWQRNNLWDPHMEPGNNSFALLRKRVAANTPGFVFRALPEQEQDEPVAASGEAQQAWRQAIKENYFRAFRIRLARVIREQRLRITTLTNEHKNSLRVRQQQHQQRLAEYQQLITEKTSELQALQQQNDALGLQVQEASERFASLEQRFNEQQHAEQIPVLTDEVVVSDIATGESAALQLLQERLDHREMELFYRLQQETSLNDEIAHMRDENVRLLEQGGDYLLPRLQQAGLRFVSIQPGVGTIELALSDLPLLLNNPQQLISRFAGVNESVYRAWLAHYQQPCCQHRDTQGHFCGQAILRTEVPLDFIAGESDCCELHQPRANICHG